MNIGVVVEDLGASHLSYVLIKSMNRMSEEDSENDYSIFIENITPHVLPPRFAVMNTTELPYFKGALIATNVSTCLTVSLSISNSKKFFYVWDLEWLRHMGKNYEYNIKAYTNKSMSIIARSGSHADAIKNYCNREVAGIVEDFNMTQMMEIINNEIR